MKKYLLGGLAAAGLLLGGLTIGNSASASDTSHILYVGGPPGTPYNSYKEAGGAIHWETPSVTVGTLVTFPERNQTWDGNGADKLPCAGGIHWISNDNVLTLSHCLVVTTTTTTTLPPTTTTTTTLPPTTTTTTTLPPTTTTTTTLPATTTTTTVRPTTTTTTLPATTTTTTVASLVPTTAVGQSGPVPPAVAPAAPAAPAAVVAAVPTQLPSTGSSSWGTAMIALAALLGGLGLVKLSRRSS